MLGWKGHWRRDAETKGVTKNPIKFYFFAEIWRKASDWWQWSEIFWGHRYQVEGPPRGGANHCIIPASSNLAFLLTNPEFFSRLSSDPHSLCGRAQVVCHKQGIFSAGVRGVPPGSEGVRGSLEKEISKICRRCAAF